MTVDEIKQTYSMKDIISRYGISTDRKGFCCCPLHKEKTPSMQIKQRSFTCYGCGEHGDIFDFVMKMDNLSWKDAFLSLGGTYDSTEMDFFAKQRLERAKLEREKRVKAEIRRLRLKRELSSLITVYRSYLVKLEPYSDIWCKCQQNVFYLLYAWDEKYINGNEVDVSGIVSRYKQSEFVRDIVG